MKSKRQPITATKRVCLALAVAGSLWVFGDSALAEWSEDSARADAGVGQQEQEIVARVNGEPVPRAELQRMLADPMERQRLQRNVGVEDPDGDSLDRMALRELIHRRLILQEARRRHVTITESDLDQAVTSLRRRFADLGSFAAWMKERGLDDRSLIQSLRHTMIAARVMGTLVEGVRVSDEAAQQYYEAHKKDLRTEEVWIQIIVVKERATAQEIQAASRNGVDFGALARQQSLGRHAAQGGDMGWVDSETLWPPLRQAVGTLKAHEAIGPLPRGDEFLIIRLEGRRPGRTKSRAEARPDIERRVLASKQQDAIQAWLTEQEKNSEIEIFLQVERSTSERHARE